MQIHYHQKMVKEKKCFKINIAMSYIHKLKTILKFKWYKLVTYKTQKN